MMNTAELKAFEKEIEAGLWVGPEGGCPSEPSISFSGEPFRIFGAMGDKAKCTDAQLIADVRAQIAGYRGKMVPAPTAIFWRKHFEYTEETDFETLISYKKLRGRLALGYTVEGQGASLPGEHGVKEGNRMPLVRT